MTLTRQKTTFVALRKADRMNFFGKGPSPWGDAGDGSAVRPLSTVSTRTFGRVLEEALMDTFTRRDLEVVLAEELHLTWSRDDTGPGDPALSKRELVGGYIRGWSVPELASFARRLEKEVELSDAWLAELRRNVDAYESGGGVERPTKNLIYAANGPKPDIVLRDAVSNDIQIVANAEHCLVYDQPVPAEGLRFARLVGWWRDREGISEGVDDREVGLALHERLLDSLDSGAERVVFEAYASGTRPRSTSRHSSRRCTCTTTRMTSARVERRRTVPRWRQRMDFLLVFSDRKRVVIEVDGKHHYADGATASPARYAEMVSEDRRLRLAGYEVYRFGGYELTQRADASSMVKDFFDQLADRMK
jgi:very-short-patch-repair endonuclease